MDDNIIRFPGFLITADRNGCWTEVLSGAVAKAAQARGRGWLIARKYRFEPLVKKFACERRLLAMRRASSIVRALAVSASALLDCSTSAIDGLTRKNRPHFAVC